MTYIRDPRNPYHWESDGVYNGKYAAKDGTLHDSPALATMHESGQSKDALREAIIRLRNNAKRSYDMANNDYYGRFRLGQMLAYDEVLGLMKDLS